MVGLAKLTNGFLLESRPYRDLSVMEDLIREAVRQTGLEQSSEDTPFTEIIAPGMTVLLKPNWVLHRNLGNHGMTCMVTQPGFILATLAEALKANPRRVILADAPVQSCIWDQVVSRELRDQARRMARNAGVALDFIDFRRTVVADNDFCRGLHTEMRDKSRYVLFDLGADSLLEPVSTPTGRFRVTNYNPDELTQTHRPGRHRYLLCREVFEADVVISMPKLKLHHKAGLTAALKNLVGFNGNKDYLPHHRTGGSHSGGDCYFGHSRWRHVAEFLLDQANRKLGTASYRIWEKSASSLCKLVVSAEEGGLEGNWYGNDTCWRMVLDLNRILLYGRSDGTMADTPERVVWSLTDAIVCGEGEGPLAPRPVMVGAVTFSDCAPMADAVHCALLGLDEQRIPLVRESFGSFRWPLTTPTTIPQARYQGRILSLNEVAAEFGVKVKPPVGWAGHIERELHK